MHPLGVALDEVAIEENLRVGSARLARTFHHLLRQGRWRMNSFYKSLDDAVNRLEKELSFSRSPAVTATARSARPSSGVTNKPLLWPQAGGSEGLHCRFLVMADLTEKN